MPNERFFNQPLASFSFKIFFHCLEFYIRGWGLWSISKANIMIVSLVISVLLNSSGL